MRGNFVAMWSDRNVSRSDLAKFISGFGTPVIVSSDTNPLPGSVEKISSLFSARVSCPEITLSRKEKYDLTRSFRQELDKKWNNRHERDALASALYAWGKVRNLMERIDKKLKPYESEKLEWNVKSNVILRGRNIDNSIESFMKGIR